MITCAGRTKGLRHLLGRNHVLGHPFIAGEIALGNLADRAAILHDLAALPQAVVARPDDVDALIGKRSLFGRGIGYVDCHLLAATLMTPHALLWTEDRRLAVVADSMSLSAVRTLH